MRRTHITLLSAGIFLGALNLTSAVLAQGEQMGNVPMPPQVQQPAADSQSQALASNEPALSSDDVVPGRSSQNGIQDAPAGQNSYTLNIMLIDYKEYKVGDVVPEEYRKKQYTISEWQSRNLPAPQPGTHWTYINANYILITDDSGKIVMGKSGDIFFKG